MDQGVLAVLADMAARTPEFAKRGEEWVQAIIDGILSKRADLQNVLSQVTSATAQYEQRQRDLEL